METPLGQMNLKVFKMGKPENTGFIKNTDFIRKHGFIDKRIISVLQNAADSWLIDKTDKTDKIECHWPKGWRKMTETDTVYDTLRGNTFWRLLQ